MSLNTPSRSAANRPQLVDAVIDGYVTWREESAAATAAYDRWSCAPRGARATAFGSYVAALDREEHAAAEYQRLLEQAAA
jgi:hypothetical protein